MSFAAPTAAFASGSRPTVHRDSRPKRAGEEPCSDTVGRFTLSVVVPCYNERANVVPLIRKLDAALAGIAWEVIFVDDNSPDGTATEIRRAARLDPRVRCIRRIGRRVRRIAAG